MLHFRKARLALPMPTKSATIALFAGFSLIAACGAKKDSPAAKPSPADAAKKEQNNGNGDSIPAASSALGAFLKWADFDAYALPQGTQTDADNILSTLSWESKFYANFPEKNDGYDAATDTSLTPQERADALAEKKCREDITEKGTKIEVDKDIIKITFKIKNNCTPQEPYSQDGIFAMQCVGSDLSSLKGKTLKELDPILQDAEEPNGVCGKATEFKLLINHKVEAEYKIKYSTTTSYSNDTDSNQTSSPPSTVPMQQEFTTTVEGTGRSATLSATMRPDGSPCTYKRKDNTIVLDGECWDQEASRRTSEYTPQSGRKNETQVERNIYKAKGVVEEIGSKDIWHKAGTFDVTINEWKGTVTLSPNSAPRAILTSPSGGKIDQLIPVANSEPSDSKQSATEDNGSSSSGESASNKLPTN